MVDGQVMGDAEDPAAEAGAFLIPRQSPNHPEKGLLKQVLRSIPLLNQPQQVSEERPLIALQQLIECIGVTLLPGADQVGIRCQVGSSHTIG